MSRTVFVLSAVLALAACRGRTPAVQDVGDQLDTSGPRPVAVDEARAAAVQALLSNFRRVHFETDSSTLTADAKDALSANAAILLQHPDLRVEVQGHADERGTVDYNLALGQRRAARVTDWLQTSGVPSARLAAVTFGEEMPLVAGHSERAWSQNRRAEFRVTAGSGVLGTTE